METQAVAILALLVGGWLGFLLGAIWSGMWRRFDGKQRGESL